MSVLVVGLNFKGAPLDLLERFAFVPADLPKALLSVRGSEHVREAVVLSTCNRTEVYATVDGYHAGVGAVRQFLHEFHHVPLEDFSDRLFSLYEDEAVAHLFSVASGIESMVIGEPQILTQVRRAFRAADEEGAVGTTLSALFRQAIRVGRRVRAETDIARTASTLAQAAVGMARARFGELRGRTALVVGAGKMSDLAAATLAAEGVQVLVANRTVARASAVAGRIGGEVVELSALRDAIARSDVVLASTGSPEPIVTAEVVADAMAARADRGLLVLDLAVPRDVEPAVASIPGVDLRDMDDLGEAVAPSAEQLGEIARVREIVTAEVGKFVSWQRTHALAPLLAALTERAERVRVSELKRADGALAALGARERETIEAMTRAIVSKMLHDPISALKAKAGTSEGDALVRALRRLYGLPPEED